MEQAQVKGADSNTKKNANGNATKDVSAASANDLPEGFVPVAADMNQFKPDLCGKAILRGHLVDRVEMPPTDNGAWAVFVIRLSVDSKVVDRDDHVIDAHAGDYVMIAETHTLKTLAQYARIRDAVYEIFIQPKEKVKLSGGRTMWTYVCGAAPKPLRRQDLGIMPPGVSSGAPQLAAGDSSEIPF